MSKHPVKLIVNPYADLGRAWRATADLRPVVDEIGGADWSGTVYPTHAIEIARDAAEEGYETVIAVGGDGTVHEVVNGLMQAQTSKRPRLGIVPMGSGNDFAYSLGIPRDPAEALRRIKIASPHPIDVAHLQDNHGRTEYWNNTLGIGFDTTVTLRSRKVPFLTGFPVYFIAVVQTILLNHDALHMQITTDRETWEDDLLALVLCNGSREGGGFRVSPNSSPNDGTLDYMSVRKISRPRMFRILPELMKGTHARFPEVRMGSFTHFNVQSKQPMIIHVDGEIYSGFGSTVDQIDVDILSSALDVLL